jgi:hypothetical protein
LFALSFIFIFLFSLRKLNVSSYMTILPLVEAILIPPDLPETSRPLKFVYEQGRLLTSLKETAP